MAKNKYSPNFHCKNDAQKKAIRASYARKKNTEEFNLNCGVYSIPANKIYDKNSTKEHIYLVYYDNHNNVKKVVETTHALRDDVISLIESNRMKIIQLGGDNYPTAVKNTYYSLDINDKPFRLSALRKKGSIIKTSDMIKIFDFASIKRK